MVPLCHFFRQLFHLFQTKKGTDVFHSTFCIQQVFILNYRSKIGPMKYFGQQKFNLATFCFIVNFKHISHFVLVFLLITLNMQLPTGESFTDLYIDYQLHAGAFLKNQTLFITAIKRLLIIKIKFKWINLQITTKINKIRENDGQISSSWGNLDPFMKKVIVFPFLFHFVKVVNLWLLQ